MVGGGGLEGASNVGTVKRSLTEQILKFICGTKRYQWTLKGR